MGTALENFIKDYDVRFGDFSDFKNDQEQVVEETLEVEIDGDAEVEKGFLATFHEIFEKYDALCISDEESALLESYEIQEELYAIQEAMESIRSKMSLNESPVAELLPIIAAGFAGLVGWYLKRKVQGDSAIPRPVVNTLYDINQFVKGGKEQERREIIKNSVLKANPGIDAKTVDSLVTVALKNADKLEKFKPAVKDSRKSGAYETDFAAINKKRFNLA